MAQLNLHVTPQFERELSRLMRLRGIRTKSEAIRLAVRESLERARETEARTSFGAWRGAALDSGRDLEPRFLSKEELWKRDGG